MSESPDTSFDVLVVGSDAAALIAALDCARIGLRVVVLATPPNSHRPDVFSHREGVVVGLLTELGLESQVNDSPDAEGSIAGIPTNPFGARVREKLGWRGAWRIYRDRITPLLTIGTESRLGSLVRRRLGAAAQATLVDPALVALYGMTSDELTVSAVIPGLNQAMTRAGSLTTGVIELLVADPRVGQTVTVGAASSTSGTSSTPGTSGTPVTPGIDVIEAALRERLAFFAARIIEVTAAQLSTRLESSPSSDNATVVFCATAVLREASNSEPSNVEPSDAEPSDAEPSDAEPSNARGLDTEPEGRLAQEVPDSPTEFSVFASAALINSQAAFLPDSGSEETLHDLVGEAGISPLRPGLESAVPAARLASAALRRVLLSNPERLPLGPRDLEG